MIPALTRRVRETIRFHNMVRAGDHVAVAVSGGADSVGLLRVMASLRAELGVTLSVIHFNHQLRGADSDGDEAFVASLARALNSPFLVERADVALFAKENRLNLEDAGRRLRYRFFERVLANGAATRVATAHTADDQAETVLGRIIRGTGLAGLSSIYPVRGEIVRPLLEARREELRHYLSSIHQTWREDDSNADMRRLRGRIRKELLPALERNFSSAIVKKLGELANLARDENAFWEVLVQERCQRIVKEAEGAYSIKVSDLVSPQDHLFAPRTSPPRRFLSLAGRIIRHLHSATSSRPGELSQRHVQQVIWLADEASSGKTIELPGGVQVRREFDRLLFAPAAAYKQEHTQAPLYSYAIELPTHGSFAVSIPEIGRRFHLKVIDWPLRERETRVDGGVILDTEPLRPPLILRNWRPGDAYCPSGRRVSRKLTRMLTAARIGRSERALWPVLTSAGRVVWANQLPPAADFSATEATQTAVWIVEEGR